MATAAAKNVEKAPEVAKAPEPEPEKVVDVAYLGNGRVEHTLTGKVFVWGAKHKMTEGQYRDLIARTATDDFELV